MPRQPFFGKDEFKHIEFRTAWGRMSDEEKFSLIDRIGLPEFRLRRRPPALMSFCEANIQKLAKLWEKDNGIHVDGEND